MVYKRSERKINELGEETQECIIRKSAGNPLALAVGGMPTVTLFSYFKQSIFLLVVK
jgi:hypothetical protein